MNPAWWIVLGPLCWIAVGIPIGILATRKSWKMDGGKNYSWKGDAAGFTFLWPIGVFFLLWQCINGAWVEAIYTPSSIRKRDK